MHILIRRSLHSDSIRLRGIDRLIDRRNENYLLLFLMYFVLIFGVDLEVVGSEEWLIYNFWFASV